MDTGATQQPISGVDKLLSKMPQEVAESFTEEQLLHLNNAMGTRGWKTHKVDIRTTFPVPFVRSRIYLVFLLGRNRRELTRQEKRISAFTMAAIVTGFILFSLVFGFLVLYLVKSLLGINLFDNYSFGLGHWFWDLWK